jgi:hypothetical protein
MLANNLHIQHCGTLTYNLNIFPNLSVLFLDFSSWALLCPFDEHRVTFNIQQLR